MLSRDWNKLWINSKSANELFFRKINRSTCWVTRRNQSSTVVIGQCFITELVAIGWMMLKPEVTTPPGTKTMLPCNRLIISWKTCTNWHKHMKHCQAKIRFQSEYKPLNVFTRRTRSGTGDMSVTVRDWRHVSHGQGLETCQSIISNLNQLSRGVLHKVQLCT